MEGRWRAPEVFSTEKSMGSGSSDTAGKQSSKLSHQYLVLRKIPTTVDSLLNRLKQAASPGNSSKHHNKLDFFVQRVVPGAAGMVTDKVGANDLISALNVPSEIKAICCSFLRTSEGAKWGKDIFKAIDAIGKCQNLEKLTVEGELELKHFMRLCQSVRTSNVGHLEVNLNMLYGSHITMTTVCKMVESNHNLKHLTFFGGSIDRSEAVSLGSMLARNSTLEHLDLGDTCVDPDEIEALLRPLTGAEGQLPVNTSLKHISVPSVSKDKIGHRVAEAVAAMLTSNKTLTHLRLVGNVFSEPSDVCMVLQSLRTNETLQILDLCCCQSHFEWGEDVFIEMLQFAQGNSSLKSIELSRAQFEEGHIEAIKAQLAANAIKRSGRNVENLRKKTLHNPMMLQFLDEIEVPQEILECRPSDSLEIGVDNLEENEVMQNTTSIANDRSQFYLRNDVLGTSTSSIESVTLDIDDLLSRLNMPCAVSVIDCNFQLAGSYSALDRKKRLKAIDAIGRCQSLKRLTISGKLDFEQIQQLCKSLRASQVEFLELCISGLPYIGLTSICEMLMIISNLKHFKFSGKAMKSPVGVIFGSVLAKNSTLEHLDLVSCKWGPNGIEALLQPLTGTSRQLPLNRSLKHLSINVDFQHGLRCEGAKAMARMLSSNKTLTHLNLSADYSLEPDDICLILLSLRTNENLQTLGLENCLGVRGEQVFMVMLELTQANPWLKSIELSRTPLKEEQKEAVRAQLAANAIRPSDPLEGGMDNLEECSTLTVNTSSSMDVQDNNMKSQVVGDRINITTTIELSTSHILDLFHQACNSITKVLRIKQLPRIYQQANVGVHDSSAMLQVLEKISQQNPRGIIVAARIQADEQRMQFLFANACGMASTVGVGLDFATVYWTRRNEVFVEAVGKDEWLQLWTEAFTNRSSFHNPIIMQLPHDSNIVTTKLDHMQTSEDICHDDVLGTLSACGEVLLLKLILIFFMKGQVCDNTSKPQNHDPSMTTKGSYSTWPSVELNVAQEGSEYCNFFEKVMMIGQTQLLNNLTGFLWNLIPRSGNTNGSGEGHHEGDQGASRQNGNGGHDENNHGEGDNNNDDGDGEANDGESLSSNLSSGDCAIVNVLPGFGGCWFFPLDFDSDEDLKEAYIEPRLCFKFSRTKDGNRNLVTNISTCFDLNNAIPKRNEKDCFGWFQTLLNVTLECSDAGAAKLQHNEKVLEALEEVQKHTQRVNFQLDSGPCQFTFQVQAGIPVAKGTLGVSKSTKKKSLVTESAVEITNQQILGGFVPTKRTKIGIKPCLSFDFDFPIYPTDLNAIDEQKRNWYLRYGLCSTVSPIIEGTWDQLNNAVASLYTFRARRNVCKLIYEPTFTRNQFHTRILGMTKSKKPKTRLMEIEQLYEVKLYVNHEMTHLCKLQTLRENESCDLMKVGLIERDPTISGSSSASSSDV
ncbi:unnamed protein product [Sphagnum tenellum]